MKVAWYHAKDIPSDSRNVLLCFVDDPRSKRRDRCVGFYARHAEIMIEDFEWDDCFYDDHTGATYIPEGWYGISPDYEQAYPLDVTHWQELPPFPPRNEENEG